MMTQIAMFVDGWNFYYSLDNARLKTYGWCDFALLARQQTGMPNADVRVKYFTSEDKPHPEKIGDRQRSIWWRALEFRGCEIKKGEFRSTSEEVEEHNRTGGKIWREKMTDVWLAAQMVADCNRVEVDLTGAFRWRPGFDRAVLLTADSDFVPLVKIVAGEPFRRTVHVLLPPSSRDAQNSASRIWGALSGPNVHIKQLSKTDLALALLPLVVLGSGGKKVQCHHSWMWREKHILSQRGQSTAGS